MVVQAYLEKAHDDDKRELERYRTKAKNAELSADPKRKATYRAIECNMMPSLTALRGADGTLKADPEFIDSRLQEAWQSVYDGNVHSHARLVVDFLATYWPQIFRSNSVELPELDGNTLKQACLSAQCSAAGMDSWSPADF
eukprot:8552580-Karenia_brevis.AAC.1